MADEKMPEDERRRMAKALAFGTKAPQDTPDASNEPTTRLTLTDTEREAAFLNGPTLFSNRYTVLTYPDGAVRLVFAEQTTANPDIPPVFRGAIYLTAPDAREFARILTSAIQAKTTTPTAG